jgi:hypothetical protein
MSAHSGENMPCSKTAKVRPSHIACYCRVSSDSQKHDSQREEIKRWLKGNRIALADVTWYEDTETGATIKRTALQRLQHAVFHGDVDTLVFWKLDRIIYDDILREAQFIADLGHGHIAYDIWEQGNPERSW